ncbi:DNA alkylation repair protein [Clostridium cibarium]|uniref:DNA alkylation repair protein n=1 Tax=Clostridium cibarium TaxID=2762247 RepID=A0ABR8PUQ6_9CLOT|nr:DNA alkylation repair protein [Clostridium cibarium]MBD7911896.1 DNA alkylation repair protein [Clostridium cibarium]
MGAQLKDIYNEKLLHEFGEKVHNVYCKFDPKGFTDDIITGDWDSLPLKARMRRITETLGQHLPMSYGDALNVLFSIDESCIGFPYLFFPDFVEVYGQEEKYLELSMKALERFTQRSSSEFAIRPFIVKYPDRVMKRMMIWAKHPNEHVRRLASEGSRPRLPWGMALQIFKKDPSQVINILEQLKNDPSLYVRKSVANNLNDISKDNPIVVLDIVKKWININPYTDWILRKGCRTLIRNGNLEAMKLFGYTNFLAEKLQITEASISLGLSSIKIGESCEFRYELDIPKCESAHIRIEYGIDFVKARGNKSRKLFLLSDKTVEGGAHISGIKIHSFADLTTRRHYPGEHRIALLINGQEKAYTILKII